MFASQQLLQCRGSVRVRSLRLRNLDLEAVDPEEHPRLTGLEERFCSLTREAPTCSGATSHFEAAPAGAVGRKSDSLSNFGHADPLKSGS